MQKSNSPIDLVYLWVDGSDPEWMQKRNAAVGNNFDDSEENCAARYVNNDELRYSLRSAEQHAPWIRKIFIVTDNQTPEWLDTSHPKIEIIDHKDILPEDVRPNFNAMVIEYFLYKIPGLAERFLFANDDMLFNADVSPDFFFAADGYPIVRLKRKPLGKWHHRIKPILGKQLGQYRSSVINATLLVEKLTGKYYSGEPHHNIDAYLKSDFRNAVEQVFAAEVKKSQRSRTRSVGNLTRAAFSYYALAIGHAHARYISRKESCTINMERENHRAFLDQYNPILLCVNDTQKVTDADRSRGKQLLQSLFGKPSQFEKRRSSKPVHLNHLT